MRLSFHCLFRLAHWMCCPLRTNLVFPQPANSNADHLTQGETHQCARAQLEENSGKTLLQTLRPSSNTVDDQIPNGLLNKTF